MAGPRFRLDGSDRSQLAVVVRPLEAAGWTQTEGDDWDLWWTSGRPVPPAVYAAATAQRRVNHIPDNGALTNKGRLARELRDAMSRVARMGGGELEPWHPRTFVLPTDRLELVRAARAAPERRWICKPVAGARGEGVHLAESAEHAARLGRGWLVQEYLAPHLIDGYKYTLRFYVAITSTLPLTVHVFDDGFTKFASRPFPRDTGDRSRFAHLTNPDVLALDPDVPTSTRNMVRAAYLDRLRADGHDPALLMRRVDELIAMTVVAARERLAHSVRRTGAPAGACFELLGLDILVDEHLKPWLIECNLDPSIEVEADPGERAAIEEADVKQRLLVDLLALVGVTPWPDSNGFRQVFPDGDLGAAWDVLALPRPVERRGASFPIPRADVSVHELGESLVVGAPDIGVRVLNGTAAHVWLARADGLEPDQIVDEIVAATGASPAAVAADVWDLGAAWCEAGLVGGPHQHDQHDRRDPTLHPHLTWNIGCVYELAGVRVALHAPSWDVMDEIDAALGPLVSHDGPVHHHLEVRPHRAGFVFVADGGPPGLAHSRETLGAGCRAQFVEWAFADAPGVVAEGVALAHTRGALVVTGSASARSALVDAWVADGRQVIADHLVWIRDGNSWPLHIDRETVLPGYVHVAGVRVPLDVEGRPVRRDPLAESSRCTVVTPVAAIVSLDDSRAAHPRRCTPEQALMALLATRGDVVLGHDALASLVALVRVVPAFAVGHESPPAVFDAMVSDSG